MATDDGAPDRQAIKSKLSWLSEGILLASVPAAGYCLIYFFELGFCDYFRIPPSFISLELGVVLGSGAWVWGALLPFILVFNLAPHFLGLFGSTPVRRSMLRVLIVSLVLVPQCIGQYPWDSTRVSLFLIGFVIALEFLFPLLTQRGKHTYAQKLQAQEEVERKTVTLIDIAISRGGGIVILALLFAFFVMISMAAGRRLAKSQEEFLISAGDPSKVILRQYGDRFVISTVNRDQKEIEKTLLVLPAAEVCKDGVYWERIGPLKSK